jgi:integrase
VSAHYAVQMQVKGRHMSLGLHTGNREVAARKAAALYNDFVTLGVEAALAKHRPPRPVAERIATIGEYIEAARAVMDVRPISFVSYTNSARLVAASILYPAAETRRTRKIDESVDAAPLSIFTLEAVQRWRLGFVARAKGDPRRGRAARISANAIIAQAKSLFSPRVTKYLSALRLPDPLPFAGIERFPRESQRYVSRINAGELLRSAREELAVKAPAAFLTILLALAGGLRRGEIDSLLWENVDLDGGRLIVDSEQGRLKTAESHGEVDIDEQTVEILRGYRARATGRFVIEGGHEAGNSSRIRSPYRCKQIFAFVVWWLRRHGVDSEKPLHTLRKESGALVVSHEGIYAASRHLRHRDIAITASHYADKKSRTVIDVAELLKTEAGPSNVVSMPEADRAEAEKKPKRTRRRIL